MTLGQLIRLLALDQLIRLLAAMEREIDIQKGTNFFACPIMAQGVLSIKLLFAKGLSHKTEMGYM